MPAVARGDRDPAEEVRALRVELAESERARVEAELTVQRMQGSLSWRLTAPLRAGMERVRARRTR
jgi:hypothetical protein